MKNKWESLIHNGVLFPPEYEYKKYKVSVLEKEIILSAEAEELAYAWAQKLETEYVQDKVFQKNFWEDFSQLIPVEYKKTRFPQDWNFYTILKDIQKKKLEKKEKDKYLRLKEKKEKLEIKEKYGYAVINGNKTSLANYIIEPPGLFMGRGKAPLRGHWKPRIMPEHVTLNMSKDCTYPIAPTGHNWMKIVENKKALWIAMWIERLTGRQKKILFSQTSFVRQSSDIKKFSKAIELANRFEEVTTFIERHMKSTDKSTREIATICNIIAKLSIRVGDEKDDDEADTRGATTLLVENIKINDNEITFDFLGKDSIRYYNIVTFSNDMISNMKEFINGKEKHDKIFTNITSKDVNQFLNTFLPGLTAKQFRTATGSTLLAKELRSHSVDKNEEDRKKLLAFTEANLEVALKLNHQTEVPKAYNNILDSLKEKISLLKDEYKIIKTEGEKILIESKKMMVARVERAKAKYTGQKQKKAIKMAKEDYKTKLIKYETKIDKIKNKIQELNIKMVLKQKTKGINISTSRLNYASPRIVFSWCKDVDLPIEKIYTKPILEKFSWASDTDADYYKKYPNVKE